MTLPGEEVLGCVLSHADKLCLDVKKQKIPFHVAVGVADTDL